MTNIQWLTVVGLIAIYTWLGRHAIGALIEWRRRTRAFRRASEWARHQHVPGFLDLKN